MALTTRPVLHPLLCRLRRHSPLTAEEGEALLGLPVTVAPLHAGTYLLSEGDTIDISYVLLSGTALRHKGTSSGARQILAVQFAGDMLSFDTRLLARADHNIQLCSDADVACVSREALDALAEAVPAIGRALLREMLIDVAIAREWILNVGRRNAQQRIAHLLCEIVLRQPEGQAHAAKIDCSLTQEQLADATGLTPVHVNRTLQHMRSAGLVETQRQKVAILDWTGLSQAGDFNAGYLNIAAGRALKRRSA
jgi:CRP-like cAMP-binding protein